MLEKEEETKPAGLFFQDADEQSQALYRAWEEPCGRLRELFACVSNTGIQAADGNNPHRVVADGGCFLVRKLGEDYAVTDRSPVPPKRDPHCRNRQHLFHCPPGRGHEVRPFFVRIPHICCSLCHTFFRLYKTSYEPLFQLPYCFLQWHKQGSH